VKGVGEEMSDRQPAVRAYKGRSSTGINGLDLALEGGFIPGTSVLLIGSATSGLDRFARQFWSVSSESRSFFMLDGYPEEGMVYARALPAQEIFRADPGKGLVIDSLSTLIMKDGIDQALSGVVSSRQRVQEAKDHAFFTLYRGLHAPYNEILLIRLCDVVIELHEEVRGNEIIRALEVKKISGMQPPGRLLPFIVTEKGIELSTTSRVV
jgi:KaiC/GvpD/RAD55 family RecA-like ATPase